tara:strand:- start:741 stop:1568 length:828 start_codon:yes stop_codon:yes gene_type:complete
MNDVLKKLIKQFMPFAQEHIGFEHPPKLFLRNDSENAKNPLAKTAFYDPEAQSVTLYVTDRHPKDILRSLGHELVHHKQNCDGEFDGDYEMGPGYAQKDPHLRRMEEDANQKGSMCLRDFEDKLKKENTIYYEHLRKGDKKMSTKNWKNDELRTILAEAWGFKFNTLQEFEEFDEQAQVQTEGEEEVTEEGAEAATEEAVEESAEEPVSEETVTEDDETLEEEEEIEEAEKTSKKMVDHDDDPDTPEVPDYAADGKGDKDLKEAIAAVLRKHLKD